MSIVYFLKSLVIIKERDELRDLKAEKKEIAHFSNKGIFCLQTEVQNEPVRD